MSYNLTFEEKENYLWVTATGIRSLENTLAITKDVFAACEKHKTSKVIIDVRALEGRLATGSSFSIPAQHFPKLRNRNIVTQAAVIDLKEFEHSYQFFENAAVKQGFKLRIFSNPDKAVFWLKK